MSRQPPPTVLLFDCDNALMRLAFSSAKRHGPDPELIAADFLLRAMIHGTSRGTDRLCFAFDGDSRKSRRREQFPAYKENRVAKKAPPEMRDFIFAAYEAKEVLWAVLPAMGFRNVWRQTVFEADDMLASGIVDTWKRETELCVRRRIIISTDHDLWQLLRPCTDMMDLTTRKVYSVVNFKEQWGLEPTVYPQMLAMAGCDSDGVPGLPGVGLKTAAKWLRGEVAPNSKVGKLIATSRRRIQQNDQLVRLPHADVEPVRVEWDKLVSYPLLPAFVRDLPNFSEAWRMFCSCDVASEGLRASPNGAALDLWRASTRTAAVNRVLERRETRKAKGTTR